MMRKRSIISYSLRQLSFSALVLPLITPISNSYKKIKQLKVIEKQWWGSESIISYLTIEWWESNWTESSSHSLSLSLSLSQKAMLLKEEDGVMESLRPICRVVWWSMGECQKLIGYKLIKIIIRKLKRDAWPKSVTSGAI